MPWFGFTKYGTQDIPKPDNPISIGQIFMYPSTIAKNEDGTAYVTGPPPGYLRCDGGTALIASYEDLYNFLNDSGVLALLPPAPVGYFRLPNMNGRFPVGLKTSDSDFDTIAKSLGSSSHTHTALLSHTHATPGHAHAVTDHTHSYGNHSHDLPAHTHTAGSLVGSANTSSNTVRIYSGPSRRVAKPYHNHDVIGTSASATGDTSDPKDASNNDKNVTSTVLGSIPNTVSTSDTSLGAPSSAVTLQSLGGVDSIPPYYAVYFIIKA